MTTAAVSNKRKGRHPTVGPRSGNSVASRLAKLLTEARKAQGASQRIIADRSGMKFERYNYIECGHEPKVSELVALCRALGLSLSAVLKVIGLMEE